MIFLDTNVVSETLRRTPDPAVVACLVRNDAELGLPAVTIAEIDSASKIFTRISEPPGWTAAWPIGATALPIGSLASSKRRHTPTAPERMIAAIARIDGARLATQNLSDFTTTGLELIFAWNFQSEILMSFRTN